MSPLFIIWLLLWVIDHLVLWLAARMFSTTKI
ncbi:hypothetical protein SM12BL1_21920 [Serratia marcescens]|nr:hypothetical protein SCH909_2785 [Serratia marcescens]CUY10385.1 Uncharacterised protein [Serratia marcescens]CUY40329.1 Uncharacterised protein [Serratia marcescens]CUY50959.1 Uncharacterised protein [Serratia marcescens]CUY61848.1 Uncharacterised protein [Serratia marcescens]